MKDIKFFLRLDLDLLFKKLFNEIKSQIVMSIKEKAISKFKEVTTLEKTINTELKKINRVKILASLKPEMYENNQELSALFSLKKDLLSIAKSLRDLQAQIYEQFNNLINNEIAVKKVIYNSIIGQEINVIILQLEDNINQLDSFLN